MMLANTMKKSRQYGMTLIELLVGSLVGLLVVGGAIQIFLGIGQTSREINRISALQETLFFVGDLLARDIRNSDYLLDFWPMWGSDIRYERGQIVRPSQPNHRTGFLFRNIGIDENKDPEEDFNKVRSEPNWSSATAVGELVDDGEYKWQAIIFDAACDGSLLDPEISHSDPSIDTDIPVLGAWAHPDNKNGDDILVIAGTPIFGDPVNEPSDNLDDKPFAIRPAPNGFCYIATPAAPPALNPTTGTEEPDWSLAEDRRIQNGDRVRIPVSSGDIVWRAVREQQNWVQLGTVGSGSFTLSRFLPGALPEEDEEEFEAIWVRRLAPVDCTGTPTAEGFSTNVYYIHNGSLLCNGEIMLSATDFVRIDGMAVTPRFKAEPSNPLTWDDMIGLNIRLTITSRISQNDPNPIEYDYEFQAAVRNRIMKEL